MRVSFRVDGLPPKKDGANSMWGKPAESEKIRALRRAAALALAGGQPFCKCIRLELVVHVGVTNDRLTGDLDNFIAGVCDGLQAADGRARISGEWEDEISPAKALGIADDAQVVEIAARKVVAPSEQFYEVTLEGDHA